MLASRLAWHESLGRVGCLVVLIAAVSMSQSAPTGSFFVFFSSQASSAMLVYQCMCLSWCASRLCRAASLLVCMFVTACTL